MTENEKFEQEKIERVKGYPLNNLLKKLSGELMEEADKAKYEFNFTWLGRPIIQYPQDIIAIQEIIWSTRPDVIIETGVAHGGSVIFSASMLALLGGDRFVIGVDIDIRAHNRIEIESHPLSKRIVLIQGSSIDPAIVKQVRDTIKPNARVMVILDSNHTHAHVLAELEQYASLVTKGNYLVVCDTSIEDLSGNGYLDRPWKKGNNPKTAVHEFLKTTEAFVIDKDIENKLLITSAPDGYLKRVWIPQDEEYYGAM